MARNEAVLTDASSGTADGQPAGAWRGRRRPRLKLVLFTAVLVSLGAIVAFAVFREATGPTRTASARPALSPSRPAMTPVEEIYARALWSIHGEVKDGAYRMTFGGLKYKLGDIDRAELKARVWAAAGAYRQAEARIRALTPPPSLQGIHAEYLEAVRLYRDSAAEMAKVSEDGRDDHLAAALPLSQEASRKLLRVGKEIWPGEYVPN